MVSGLYKLKFAPSIHASLHLVPVPFAFAPNKVITSVSSLLSSRLWEGGHTWAVEKILTTQEQLEKLGSMMQTHIQMNDYA